MPKFPKPFYRSARNAWYVQLGKEQIKLHEDEEQAFKAYHALMTERANKPTLPISAELTVAQVFDKFLHWCEKNRELRTFEGYYDHIQRFCTALPATQTMPATSLKPYHVTEFVDGQKGWSPAYKKQAIQAVQRPFAWAEKQGHIDKSPIRGIEKPKAQRREQFVSESDWIKIRDEYKDGDPFRDILEFCWECGCRPQEAKRAEPRHVHLKIHSLIFPKEESKGKRRPRVIVMTPRAEEIIARRMRQKSKGPLFLNEDGRPWNSQSMSCRFGRLKAKIGIKFSCYDLRHGFATRMLMNNRDSMTVATLLGHRDTRMLAEHYAHLERQTEFLRNELTRT